MKKFTLLVSLFIVLGMVTLMGLWVNYAASQPDFQAVGTVVDKTTGISGGGFLGGRISTYYTLTIQYFNPNSNQTEKLNTGVSADKYSKTNTGDTYPMVVHTGAGLIRVDLTSANAMARMADPLPIISFVGVFFGGIILIYLMWRKPMLIEGGKQT